MNVEEDYKFLELAFSCGGPSSLEMDKFWPAQDFFTNVMMAELGR